MPVVVMEPDMAARNNEVRVSERETPLSCGREAGA